MGDKSENPLITKVVLQTGTKHSTFMPGTRVSFHFQTRKCDEEETVVDDSRKLGKPMELVLGKNFKFEVWEVMVQMMALNEVATFVVDKRLLYDYPFLSEILRDAGNPQKQHRSHCCGDVLQNEGTGYEDLNQLIKEPCNLAFTIELFKAEAPGDYEEESWQMNEEEKLNTIPSLHAEGNSLFRDKDYRAAADKYAMALGMLEQLMLVEKPGEKEWLELDEQKVPLLINLSQCKLYEKEYHSVIEHCSTVLKSDPDNVRALLRRAKAHVGVWNPQQARVDYTRVMQLDQSLEATIQKKFKKLEEMERILAEEGKSKLEGEIC